MATIKSYTDLEQSKKLAEILPLETADMYHFIDNIDKVYEVGFGYRKITADYYLKTKLEYLPCWSLTALLNALPNDNSKCTTMTRGRYDTRTRKYINEWCAYYNEINGANCMNVFAENPVDACVAMIERLQKSNLL
jgi:hypothetical protein